MFRHKKQKNNFMLPVLYLAARVHKLRMITTV